MADDGKIICPTCETGGLTSFVDITGRVDAATNIREFYDPEGNYHCHNTGSFQTSYSCDKGHSWTNSTSVPCPMGDF